MDWVTVVSIGIGVAGVGYAALSAGHKRIAAAFFISAGLFTLGMIVHWAFAEAVESDGDPERFCFIDFEVPTTQEGGLFQTLIIGVRVQNRYNGPISIVLLNWSAGLKNFPALHEEMKPEPNVLYPEHKVVGFGSDRIDLGDGIRAGTTVPGWVNFLIRHGPPEGKAATLRIKGRVWITFLQNGLVDVRWLPDNDSTPDCVGAEKLINRDLPTL